MLLGTHRHRLDEKGRLVLPSAFRPFIGTQAVVTLGLGGEACLYLFPMPKWNEVIAKVDTLPLGSREARWARRLLMGNAHLVTLDRVGRILIPAALREAARIQQDVVLVGLQTYAELWAPEVWEQAKEAILQDGISDEQWAALGI